MSGAGWVYLVGAGPGDPGLVTARGLALVRSCDVLLYDRLVPPELLEEAPNAERIFVGKRPGEEHSRQLVADALMIERAKGGAMVVRLKGGDPFVFGRGAEELELLVQSEVPFEVVPGVTSATSAAAYAGIPVTHRGVARNFAVLTANEEAEGSIPWDQMATGPDTLVLMMGVRALRSAAGRLISRGRDPQTPAAVVEWGTLPRQRVVTGPLEKIGELAADAGIRSPATTYIGEVVKLRDTITWFERRPLHGVRVVVTRAKHQAQAFGDILAESGAEVIYLPAIEIVDPESFVDVDLAAKKLAEGLYAWVVFTSANGLEKFFERIDACGYDARAFARTKVAAVGSVTATMLAERGIKADFVPETFTAEALSAEMDRGVGRVLLPRVENGPTDIVELLRGAGWTPEDCATYRNVLGSASLPSVERVRAGRYDVVTFASASATRAFVELVGDPQELGLGVESEPDRLSVACIGPRTAEAARALGFRVDVVAEEHTAQGLNHALIEHFSAPAAADLADEDDEDTADAEGPEGSQADDGTMEP
ncbi:MAG: uroporphyrinogen-III C-methyltransferase [Actinomycetota bacterium]